MKTPMKTAAGLALSALMLLGLLGLANPASARDGDVIRRGSCTNGAVWKLKLAPRDGRIEWEFEVDSNRNGQPWSVRVTDNNVAVFNATRTTVAPSGSFSVERTSANRAGTDRFVAVARNTRTGQTCTGRASL
jgi:hypothetical protein